MKDNKEIKDLIEKYFSGDTSLEEEKQLQSFFQQEDISTELKTYRDQFSFGSNLSKVSTRLSDDDLFAKIDSSSHEDSKVVRLNTRSKEVMPWFYRVAAVIALVAVAFYVGGKIGTDTEVKEMRAEIDALKNELQSNSASGRLQAVSQVSSGTENQEELMLTLIAVMKNDPNMHVRTKATEALGSFEANTRLVDEVTSALLEEKEPAVQIAMIETLVKLKDSRAIQPLEQLAQEGAVLKEIRDEAYMGVFKLKEM